MTAVSIIGSGRMGKALKALFDRAGADVEFVSREALADGTATFGDVVVLAVPYPALAELGTTLAGKVTGKVVVDITNPVDFEALQPLNLEAGSAAAELSKVLADAKIVKAFNTNFAATLANGTNGDHAISVLAAGDADAKAQLGSLVTASGATFIDAGDLARAHELEAMGYLQITLGRSGQVRRDRGFLTIAE